MPTPAQKKLILEYATDVRKFEIGLFWSRSVFFWGFITTAIAAYGAAASVGHQKLQLIAAASGFVCSFIWTLVNRSSKYWQRVWEMKVNAAQHAALEFDLFSLASNPPVPQTWGWGAKHYSVSKLAIAFSDFTLFVWLGLGVKATPLSSHVSETCAVWAGLIFIALYILAILKWCQSDSV